MEEKDKFRYAEKCLYGYKKNMACLKILQEDLRVEQASIDVHAQNYQAVLGVSSDSSSPPEMRVVKIESLQRRIQMLERWTNPINDLIKDLTSPDVLNGSNNKLMMEVLRLMYFGNNTVEMILDELNIARRTFMRIRRELVCVTIVYLGL